MLGSLECVHGSVDKGVSLLEQAAQKVQLFVLIFHDFVKLPQGVSEAHLELGLHFHAKDPRGQGGGGLTNAEQV